MAASVLFREKKLMLNLPRQYGGKTELGVRIAHDLTLHPSTSSALYIAKNTKARRKAAREKFLRLFDPKVFAVNTELIYLKRHKTSQIQMGSVDVDPDADRGGTHGLIHWSEVAFSRIQNGMTIPDVWMKVYAPMIQLLDGYALLESTNNGTNGWKELWDMAPELGFARLRVPFSRMLEMGLVSQEEFDKVKRETMPLVFDQEYECEWVTFQGRAYDELADHHFDVLPGPAPWQSVVAAIDWGWNPSATCVVFGYVQDDVLCIFDEIYAMEQLPEHTCEAIKARMKHWGIERLSIVADHEADRNQELINRGLGVAKADKVDVLGNRLQIKEKLFKGEMVIDPVRCPMTKKDLYAAVWHPKKEGDLDYTQCTWGHFDAEAAVRYLVRAFEGYEAEAPEFNPHVMTDDAAARDWMLRRQHEQEMGS